jgi:tRNA-specific 2-thiouridylase
MVELNKNRVVVAMSGGVDSSVAAALLKEQGFDVIGVSLKLWDYDEDERQLTGKTCCSLDDIADAKEVCDTLGIPFYAFNHKAEFRKSVIDVFVNEYKNGRTPNPCVLCNQSIKFDVLLNEARKMGAYYLATGHYARIYEKNGTPCLAKGKDDNKDQSYVLFHLTQDDLNHILFPVGNYTKAEIRALAKKFNLVTQSKKESMEICFIPNNDHASFIAKNYPDKKHGPGNFVDEAGNILGRHDGIDAFTVGQRRGLGIGFGDRMYVATIRADRNEVVLAPEDGLYSSGLIAERFHFVQDPQARRLGAKIRYQKNEIPVDIVDFNSEKNNIHLRFEERARAVTPGQAVVLYDGDEVIGGGWISQSLR